AAELDDREVIFLCEREAGELKLGVRHPDAVRKFQLQVAVILTCALNVAGFGCKDGEKMQAIVFENEIAAERAEKKLCGGPGVVGGYERVSFREKLSRSWFLRMSAEGEEKDGEREPGG